MGHYIRIFTRGHKFSVERIRKVWHNSEACPRSKRCQLDEHFVPEEEREYEMFSPHIWNIHSGEKLLTCNHVLCESCKKLLLQPVVLNCGHVHCEECLVGSSQFCKCSVCKSLHPNGFPKKCFALEHLIKLHLPEDYAERKLSSLGISIRHDSTAFQKRIELKTVPCASSTSICFPAWVIGHGPVVHYGSGCDQCGMLPIIGNRYHCRDCNGTSGFDLCEQCFRNFLNLPGRFDQKHNSEHKFQKITGARISFAGLLERGVDDLVIISPYIAEECRAEENGFTGPNDDIKKTSCSRRRTF